MRPWHGGTFGIGMNAGAAEFRASDVHGRPVDPSAEMPTARDERVRQLQAMWQPREVPSSEPAAVLAEWMARSQGNRMSAFARNLAEFPDRLPVMVTEAPGRPADMTVLTRMLRR